MLRAFNEDECGGAYTVYGKKVSMCMYVYELGLGLPVYLYLYFIDYGWLLHYGEQRSYCSGSFRREEGSLILRVQHGSGRSGQVPDGEEHVGAMWLWLHVVDSVVYIFSWWVSLVLYGF